MGKVRTRILGVKDVEQKQKEEQKKKSKEKKRQLDVGSEKLEEKKAEKRQQKLQTSNIKPPTKSVRGKKYVQAVKSRDKTKLYPLDEALSILKKIKYAAFDESVELHINIDEPGLRGEVELPHPIGKTIRVITVNDEVLKEIEKGAINFDVLITHPSYMPKLARFAKVLGPRGLMPNPKAGTISDKPEEVAKKFTKGMLRWKTEPKFPLIHQMIGKISADEKDLGQNATVFLRSVGKQHIMEVFIKTTMSPALKLNIESL